MTSIKSITTNTVVLGMLVFAILSFIITMQIDSELDPSKRITNNSLINESHGDLEASLDQKQSSKESLDSLEQVPPSESIGDLDVSSLVSTTRNARSIITGVWNILIKLPQIVLGVSETMASAITTILLIFIAIGIWAVWKGSIT